ncbi:MAG: RNA polymerase sigma factor [Pseudobacter sp.]|uniref:RNA polymerase sigma factor n=1 Tax=Pseudobacter sp. TaxID=2045420 RepID=UPI003F81510D
MQQNPLSSGEPGPDRFLEDLFKRYYNPMMAYAYTTLKDEALAEDIVIDSFLKVQKARPHLAAVKDIRSYLFITVRNGCFRAFTERKIRDNYLNDVAAQPPTYTEIEIFLHESLQIEDWVEQVLSLLTPSEKKIIKMSFLEGKSVKDIAEELNRSENGVAAEKSRALKKLRDNNKNLPKGLSILLIALIQS